MYSDPSKIFYLFYFKDKDNMNLNWLWITLGVIAFILILGVIIGLLVYYSRKNAEIQRIAAIDRDLYIHSMQEALKQKIKLK
jgi:hypothetical protein